ncbi:MAG: hypothetical protein WDN24_21575 [Sphingomonas sp.]
MFHPMTGYSFPDAVRTAALGGRRRATFRARGCTIFSTAWHGGRGRSAAFIACSRRCCSRPPPRTSATACSSVSTGSIRG